MPPVIAAVLFTIGVIVFFSSIGIRRTRCPGHFGFQQRGYSSAFRGRFQYGLGWDRLKIWTWPVLMLRQPSDAAVFEILEVFALFVVPVDERSWVPSSQQLGNRTFLPLRGL